MTGDLLHSVPLPVAEDGYAPRLLLLLRAIRIVESASLILGIIAVIGLLFLLRWLIPSKGKVGEKVVAGKLDHLVVSIYGILVLRSGKYGQFYGCSNYPQCKYTHPA